MDALEQLANYRHVDPVDDRLIAATADTIATAIAADHRNTVTRKHQIPSWRLTRGRRIAIAAGAVVAAIGTGSGIAAAAGVFSPTVPPPAAQTFMGSPNPAKVPGATLRLSIPGPEATTLQVVTDNVTTNHQAAACVALGIIGADGRPDSLTGHSVCSDLASPPGSPPPDLQLGTPSMSLQTWSAPSGASYTIIFGTAVPGVAAVTLSGSNGQVAASEPANPNGYVIYTPAASLPSHGHLDFTDRSGKILFSQNLNS